MLQHKDMVSLKSILKHLSKIVLFADLPIELFEDLQNQLIQDICL